ncbi:MAG: type II toxin-antitoxin system MqsA family antitoxin [Planctomycetes bacterium]|nr:type II toxin-antitoxin system MqsA family antitoxin [Planctomycetota bacterium]
MANRRHRAKAKPFPWRCPRCRKLEVYRVKISHTAQITHDGRMHVVTVPDLRVARCRSCGEFVFDHDADDQISQGLRAQLRLLRPEQLRKIRTVFGLTQRKLAERLGVAEETISRWETGMLIQSRAMDNLLRVYFAFPEVRSALTGAQQNPALGADLDFQRKVPAASRRG